MPAILIRAGAWRNFHQVNMTNKKRTTVTTIETHELWIIRRPEQDLSESEVLPRVTSADVVAISPLSKTLEDSEMRQKDDDQG